MGVWDVSTPVGGEALSSGDDRIREFKTAVQEALRGGAAEGVEAVFPGAAPTTAPIFRYRGLKGTTGVRPAAGQNGLYVNTTLGTLQRDNGSTWEDVATLIPSGTKMVFYQASAPTGWTAVAVNDKFLRVVTAGGTGGSTGGTVAASTSLAHTHSIAAGGSHSHVLNSDLETYSGNANSGRIASPDTDNALIGTRGVGGPTNTIRNLKNMTDTHADHDHGAATGSTFAGAFAYADVIIATKD